MPSPDVTPRLRFLDFELDLARQQLLRRSGEPLDLPRRQLLALQMLAERAGELVDKESLIAALWPGLVVEENNLSQTVAALRRELGDAARDSRVIQTVPRRGFRFIAPVERVAADATAARGIPRVAVLPFKPLAEGRDTLLELGMADSLIAQLSLLPWVAVLSIGSVRRYASLDQDPLRAAAELGADWVADGTWQRVDDELTVRARLLRAADGTAAWAASFQATSSGLFELQDRIGEQLAQALAPVLREQAHGRLAGGGLGGTNNLEAYRLYLQGLNAMALHRPDEMRESIQTLRRSLAIDPAHARAWVALADAHRRAAFISEMPPRDVAPEIDAAIERALTLEPRLGEAHATYGYQRIAYHHDWPSAQQAFRRSLALNPSLPLGHFGLGQLLLILKGDEQGFTHLRRAVELDPMQPLYAALEASFLRVAGRHSEAQARLQRVLQLAPAMPLVHLVLAQSRLEQGDHAGGVAALRQAVTLARESPLFEGLLGHYLARLGQTAEARAILARLRERARTSYVAATSIAAVHAGLGETDEALQALEAALQQRDARIGFIKDAPYWEGLHDEPRFKALLRRLQQDEQGPGFWNP